MKKNWQRFPYVAVFCLGYSLACGIGGQTPRTNPAATIARMLNSTGRSMAVFPPNVGNQPVVANLFAATPALTTANPSQVAQSYDSTCPGDWQGPGGTGGSSIHAFGNSGLVELEWMGPAQTVCGGVVSSVGADEGGIPQGYPVFFDGAVNTLVVYGTFVSGNRFRCVDTTNISPLTDGSYVRAYYDLAQDAVILGSGTTQLSPTCSISIPPGDDVASIEVQWVKS